MPLPLVLNNLPPPSPPPSCHCRRLPLPSPLSCRRCCHPVAIVAATASLPSCHLRRCLDAIITALAPLPLFPSEARYADTTEAASAAADASVASAAGPPSLSLPLCHRRCRCHPCAAVAVPNTGPLRRRRHRHRTADIVAADCLCHPTLLPPPPPCFQCP